ncbi:hypothetical protein F0P96_15405 [Hymenobacter busanensis]|uniref:Uncharacterized protein n=1 Tax=Hymenobacter busanensis TaxID=2607656 RepID=A0A7L4ZZT2_9BACT|nr:hypothetical protein [Hymenobacter busanensis]KAA9331617.1 hypothetical protein F0P96_15405 [Hymenobacter busanensis]QHJ08768.1 hypothetical protein GUY19_16340 [Hymenobacter busanensis]
MSALRRFLTVVVMVFLLLSLLFISLPGARDAMMSMTGGDRADFWFTMTVIGTLLLLLQLLVENVHGVSLRRDITRHEMKVNELKAKLYDHHLDREGRPAMPASVHTGTGPTFTPPAPAPNAIPRTGTAVPPPSAADLPPSAVPPTTTPYPNDPPRV